MINARPKALVTEIQCLAAEAREAADAGNGVRVVARLASIHEKLNQNAATLYVEPPAGGR